LIKVLTLGNRAKTCKQTYKQLCSAAAAAHGSQHHYTATSCAHRQHPCHPAVQDNRTVPNYAFLKRCARRATHGQRRVMQVSRLMPAHHVLGGEGALQSGEGRESRPQVVTQRDIGSKVVGRRNRPRRRQGMQRRNRSRQSEMR
jgi:hypothetical protein